MWVPVLVERNFRLGRSKRCSLYSTGPSCGSARRRVTGTALCACGLADNDATSEGLSAFALSRSLPCNQGDATRGGSGSYVKTEAMFDR